MIETTENDLSAATENGSVKGPISTTSPARSAVGAPAGALPS
jgi:hypothetical protein